VILVKASQMDGRKRHSYAIHDRFHGSPCFLLEKNVDVLSLMLESTPQPTRIH
jgi:hypothetical protein